VNAGIRASLEHARAHPEASREYIRQHAQELDPGVIARHIGMFVTEASLDLGLEGEAAVMALLAEAQRLDGPGPLPPDVFLKG
jgi:1,4-dihydroxy-6-naphthoate synthase